MTDTTHAYDVDTLVWFEDPTTEWDDYLPGVITAHRDAAGEYDVWCEARGETYVVHEVLLYERRVWLGT